MKRAVYERPSTGLTACRAVAWSSLHFTLPSVTSEIVGLPHEAESEVPVTIFIEIARQLPWSDHQPNTSLLALKG